MKVLLLKDVYKLGRAGDVKKVADGFGRNFLLPQGLAVLASVGALKQVEQIKSKAAIARAALNQEMSGFADQLNGAIFTFISKAGETGKLYGSITTSMIIDAINNKYGTHLERHQVEAQPIRTLGEHKVRVRLTVDLTPNVTIVVYREGEKSSVPSQAVPETPIVPAVEQNVVKPTEEISAPIEPEIK